MKPPKIKPTCLEEGDVPCSFDDLKEKKVATFIVYVDDLLAVENKKTLEGFFRHLQTVWDIATSEYLTEQPKNLFAF
eukprot:4777123-Amphidinium_carterae.1